MAASFFCLSIFLISPFFINNTPLIGIELLSGFSYITRSHYRLIQPSIYYFIYLIFSFLTHHFKHN